MKNTNIQNTSKYRKKPIPRGQGEKERLEIELRRQKVFELAIKGLAKVRIADILKVSVETIWSDLKVIRDEQVKSITKQIKSFNSKQYWAEWLESINLIERELWSALVESKTDRAMIVDRMIALRKEKERALISAGVKLIKENPEDVAGETLRIIYTNSPDRSR